VTGFQYHHGTRGWRCYVLGKRLHHGLFGLALGIAGAVLAWHDRRDFPFLGDR
jgi:hypothetical protein